MLIENHFHLATTMKLTKKRIASTLRQRGYKLTPQRRAVLKVVAGSHDHLTPAEIYQKVLSENRGIGLVTVYRTLELLEELGLICEVHPGGHGRSYVLRRPSEHHHHLICSDCGGVVDFGGCDLSDLEKRLAEDTGYDIEGHLLEFAGRCPNCQEVASG